MKKWLSMIFLTLLAGCLWGCSTTEEPEVSLTDPAQIYTLFHAALDKTGSRASQTFIIGIRQTNPATGEVTRETKTYSVFLSGSIRRLAYYHYLQIEDVIYVFRKTIDESPLGTFTEYATTDSEGTVFVTAPYGYDLDLNTYFSDFYADLPGAVSQYGIVLSDLLSGTGIARNSSFQQGNSVQIDVAFFTEGEETEFRATLENGYLVHAYFSDPQNHHVVAEFWVGECAGIELPSVED